MSTTDSKVVVGEEEKREKMTKKARQEEANEGNSDTKTPASSESTKQKKEKEIDIFDDCNIQCNIDQEDHQKEGSSSDHDDSIPEQRE